MSHTDGNSDQNEFNYESLEEEIDDDNEANEDIDQDIEYKLDLTPQQGQFNVFMSKSSLCTGVACVQEYKHCVY